MRTAVLSALFAAAVTSVYGAIVDLSAPSSPYHATASSKISLTFATAPTFIRQDDFSIALGVYSADAGLADSQIGALWANVDLVARNASSTTGQNVVLSGLPLPASYFTSGAGSYKIVAAVTYGNGPELSTDVHFFNAPLNVTL